MGYMRHHAIVVTSWKPEAISAAHAEAINRRLTVVPRERHPMVSVEFEDRPGQPIEYQGKVILQPHMLVIKPRSHRAYRVLTEEDAKWISQVIHEILSPTDPKPPTPRRSRSSRSAPATDASSAASSTATAAASATERRSPRGGSSS